MAKKKSFDDWTTQEVRMNFYIEQVPATPFLKDWLAAVHIPRGIVAIPRFAWQYIYA
jgi:hypothetical protein